MAGRSFVGHWLSALAVGALASFWAAPAAGYCRTMSCELGEDPLAPTCARDAHDCVTEGSPIRWPSACLTYAVQLDGSPRSGLDADELLALVEQGFRLWQTAECPGGGNPRFEAKFQGFVSCRQQEAVCGGKDANVNTIMFYDEGWPGDSSQMGLTTPAGGTMSGRLVDADVEINAEDFVFTQSTSDPNAGALFYVIAHELGHFLGLAHSDVAGSLMIDGFQSTPTTSSLLTADDIAAVCAAYPPGGALTCGEAGLPTYDSCQLPQSGSEPGCQIATPSRSSGCSVAVAASSGPLAPLLHAVGLAAFVLLLRRPRKRSVHS